MALPRGNRQNPGSVPEPTQGPRPPEDSPSSRALVPSAVVLAIAFFVSGSLHINVYAGLDALRSFLDASRPPEPVEVSTQVDVTFTL